MEENYSNSPQNRVIHLQMNKINHVPEIGNYGELTFTDILRLDRYIYGDIFGDTCIIWNGETQGNYLALSYNRKKVSLLRLLYHNYIGNVEGVKIKQCKLTKKCCTINHIGSL